MGTTLANVHILDGDEQQIRSLLPTSIVGKWSARFVSAYFEEFEPRFNEKTARALSKKLTQPVIFAWIFDNDAAGFTVYKSGKTIAEHIINPDGYSKMGNISLFCETLGLPSEDASRLRAVWKKGGAEEQLELTAMLLGLPLYYNCDILPDKLYTRDSDAVDKWIAERPVLSKIKTETKAILIQELTRFRWDYIHGVNRCCSAEPYDDECSHDSYQLWMPNEDGILQDGRSSKYTFHFLASKDRILDMDDATGVITYDSAGLLLEGYQAKGSIYSFLSDGGLLWRGNSQEPSVMTFIRCAKDGSELWVRSEQNQGFNFWGYENGEVIFTSSSDDMLWLERVDEMTGATVEKQSSPFGLNARNKVYNNGYWWVAHDGNFLKGSRQETLSKLDSTFHIVAEIPLPTFTQELFFSPDNAYAYVFFYQKRVMVLNADTLATVNVLEDKSTLGPLGFDASGRFWLRRDNSTVEAWDAVLGRPLSRHKLKGDIVRHHKTDQGVLCFVTWSKNEKVLRVYKME